MKQEYLGWGGVRKLAKKLGYSWFDVCDILWKTKHHKQPKFKEILIKRGREQKSIILKTK